LPPLPQRITFQVALEHAPGMLGRVTTAIDELGAEVVATDRTKQQRHVTFRDITIEVRDEQHAEEVAAELVELEGWSCSPSATRSSPPTTAARSASR
jgi:malate dehydrogenase (oxaloacetate-decarboxylating)